MKIAIIGAGFTGLATALKLVKLGHEVKVFEKENAPGGLASGFKKRGWSWYLDKFYHHLFADDYFALNLASKVNQKLLKTKPKTDTFIKNRSLALDSPISLLTFPYLSLIDKLRTGLTLAYFKTLQDYQSLEGKPALPWIRKVMGKKSTELLWEPLFAGKFGEYKEIISLTWFWGRIKKRSTTLYYPEGGFQEFAYKLASKITNLGGKIFYNFEVKNLDKLRKEFDKVIVTLPLPVFLKIAPKLPETYKQKFSSIPHLSAQVLILISDRPFLKNSYWLNINEPSFPFLILAQQTNFMDKKYYGGKHILYIGNYLPENHPYLKMSAKELLKIYSPYLKQINSGYKQSAISYELFSQPFAQPIASVGYEKIKPDFTTPLKNVYLANLDMVYPWDRGVNYAIELGEKVAKII